MKKLLSIAAAILVGISASAMMMSLSSSKSPSNGVDFVNEVQKKPNCTKVIEGKVCSGTLELSFTAYKEKTDQNCPFCNGTGKNCKWEHCDNGKVWEWRSAYVCQSCGALYDVASIQKQF